MSAFDQRKANTLAVLEQFKVLTKVDSQVLNTWVLGRLAQLWKVARSSNSWWHGYLPRGSEVFRDSVRVDQILSRLPVMQRATVQAMGDFSAIWLPGSNRDQYGFASTSGSTGKPVRIIKHAPTYNPAVSATSLLDAIWQNRQLSIPTVYLRAQGARASNFRIGEPFSFISEVGPTHILRSSELEPSQILDSISRLGRVNVIGNATLLLNLAREQIRDPRRDLKVLEFMNWAEALTPESRDMLKMAFSGKVSDRYSTEELGPLAIQCPNSEHLHALQFFNYVEIVDEKGLPCEPGLPGRVLVTALHNFSQPLIRYEVGDMASWQEPCGHGINLPVLRPVITRIRESVKLPDGRVIQPNATGSKISKEAKVRDFQVVRFMDALLVLYIAGSDLDQSQKQSYAEDLQKRFSTTHPVSFKRLGNFAGFKEFKRKDFILIDDSLPQPLDERAITSLLERIK